MLSVGAAFAVSDDATLSDASDDMAVEETVLSVDDDSAAIESSDDSILSAKPTNLVINSTFSEFFDDSGTLLDNVTYDELIFAGSFEGLDISSITINKPILFTGYDAIFNDISFVVTSDNVTIDGFSITQSNGVDTVFVDGTSNVVLSNNIINTIADDGICIGIHALAVDNFQLINNTITYVGNTDGTVVNNAVRIEGDDEDETPATNIVVSGNTFDIGIPSVDVDYDWTTYEPTVYSEGIVFYYVEDLMFTDNRVDVIYNDVVTAWGYDSLYAVSVKGNPYIYDFDDDYNLIYPVVCKDVVIADNNITLAGHSCTYAIFAGAEGLTISGNDIISTSETYLAHGIDIDSNTVDAMVADNVITAEAPLASYGICADGYMGPVADSAYVNNTVTVSGYSGIGIKVVVDQAPVIEENTVVVEGNYTYGIIANNGVVSGNDVYVLGSNTGSDGTGDSYMTKNSVGIAVKGTDVASNTVYSTNIGLKIVQDGGLTVEDNTIAVEANALIDNYGIYAKSVDDLTFIGNEVAFVGISNGTVVNNGVRIEGDDDKFVPAKNITFDGNTFELAIPSVDVEYDWTTYEPTVYSEGIVFYYVEDVEFVDNVVDVEFNDVVSSWGYDSLYAVSVKGNPYIYDFDDDDELIYPVVCKDVVIADNNITLAGHSCTYAIFAGAEGLEITGNDIISTSETYLAHGIDIDSNTVDAMVADNVITAEAPLASYGICADGYMGPVADSAYVNNTVTVSGYSGIGIKVVVDQAPVIEENTVVVEGNYTYGIIANNGVVSGNDVSALGSNIGTDGTGDSYMKMNSVGISVKAADVVDNTVYSTNTGLNIVQEGGIDVEGNTITVENNALIDSYGIYANVDNLTFTDNVLTYVGYSNGTVVNNGVRIEGNDKKLVPVKNITFEGNTFELAIPSVDVEYDWTTYEPTVYSEGIVFYYVEDVEFVDNVVDVEFNDVVSSWGYDSLYAVSVKGNPFIYDFDDDDELIYPVVCKDVVIANNTVGVAGHSCAYAIFAGAEGLTISGNDIISTSETYLAHGIDIDSNTVGAMVADNVIVVNASSAAYGICADGYNGPVADSAYVNNSVYVIGYSGIGIKVVVDPSPVIEENTVAVVGNYSYGIIANNGVVSGNDVYALGSNIGNDPTGDSYMTKNSVGIAVKGTDVVNNFIGSTNIGLKIVQEGGMTVENNTILVKANASIDNYGIYAKAVDDLTFIGNNLTFIGISNGTVVNNGVRIEGDDDKLVPAKNITFDGNTFDLSIPSVDVEYDWTTYEPTVYSEGIVFYYVEDVEFVDNVVDLTYNDVVSAWGYDSLYAVSVKGNPYIYDFDDDDELIYPVVCKDVVIANNTIGVDGHACAYAVFAAAEGLEISGNEIVSTSETYLAHGIDVDATTVDAWVADNVITAEAPLASYGICADSYMGPVDGSEYVNNTVYVSGYSGIGIKVVVDESPVIVDNTVVVEGNYTYGIIANAISEGLISGNNVSALGSNIGNDSTGDSYMTKNSVGISVKGDTLIENNNVYSTNRGINLVDKGDIIVHDNNILVEGNNAEMDNPGIVIQRPIDEITAIHNTVYTNGEYSVDIADCEGTVNSNYLVSDKLIGDRSVSSTGPATVYNNTPNIKVVLFATDLDKVYEDGQLFVVTALDENGDPMVNVTLVALVDSEYVYFANTSESGVAEFDIELPSGVYNVTTIYSGDALHAYREIENNITVTPKETFFDYDDMYVSAVDVAEGIVYFDFTLIDSDGIPLANKTVVIDMVDEFVTDENGTVSYLLEYGAGDYTLVMSFDGDDCYAAAIAYADIEVYLVETEIVADANMTVSAVDVAEGIAYFDLTLVDEDGIPLANKTILINDVDEFVTDENGTVSYQLEYGAGNYTLVMAFEGDDLYADTIAYADIEVYLVETEIVADANMTVSAVDVAEGIAFFDLTLVDADGNPLANKTVVIDMVDEFVTDENGTVSYQLEYGAGNYTLVMAFEGDDLYADTIAYADIEVYLVETEIVADANMTVSAVDVAEGIAFFDLTLVDADGNPLANRTVVILDGLYELVTDENGSASYQIAFGPGENTLVMAFEGDDLYAASEASADILVYLVETEIVADANMTVSAADVAAGDAFFDLTLVDADGCVLANRTVFIGDVVFVTDENGTVSYPITYGPGEYDLVMAFDGDDCYVGTDAIADITVVAVETAISADSNMTVLVSDIIDGTYFNLTLVAGDQKLANKTISITFDGRTGEFTTDENGVISYKLTEVSAGNYTIDMAFAGDDVYTASNASASVAVNKEQSKIFLRNALYFVLETKMVKVTLWDGNNTPIAGKIVYVTVYGTKYAGVTDKDGNAYIRVGVGFGTHNATVSFEGDDQYAASNRSGQIRVIKETPSIMVRGADSVFKVSDSLKIVKVQLRDRTDKPLPANSKVAIKINGQTYIGYTDDTGVASFNVKNIDKKGTYDAELTYAGNSAYNAVKRTVKIRVV